MTAPSYPIQLEQWWLDQARRVTGISDIVPCLASLEKDVERLSDLFTLERAARFGDYARDERLLLAYGLFFFPQTFVRVQLALNELPSFQARRILDLGCGSGAATFAVLSHFHELDIEARAVDKSLPFLNWAEQLFEANRNLWPRASLETEEGDLLDLRKEESWDLILVSFALNEALESGTEDEARTWLRRWLDRLAPGGVLMILEPVSQATSERLERLRDWVAREKAARILAPCLHHAACPLLNKGEVWCHEVRRWRVPETLEILNRRLFRSIEDLKFSFLMLKRSEVPEAGANGPDVFRMIAPMRKLKGKLVTAGCAADGGARTYELLTRGLNRAAEDELISIERGTVVRAVDLQPIADGKMFRARKIEREFESTDGKW